MEKKWSLSETHVIINERKRHSEKELHEVATYLVGTRGLRGRSFDDIYTYMNNLQKFARQIYGEKTSAR